MQSNETATSKPPPFLAPKPVGDYNQGMSEADHKILSAEVHTL